MHGDFRVIERQQVDPLSDMLPEADWAPARTDSRTGTPAPVASPSPAETDEDFLTRIVDGIRADVLADHAGDWWSEPPTTNWTASGFPQPAPSHHPHSAATPIRQPRSRVSAWFQYTGRRLARSVVATAARVLHAAQALRRRLTTKGVDAWVRLRLNTPSVPGTRLIVGLLGCGIAALSAFPAVIDFGRLTSTARTGTVQAGINSAETSGSQRPESLAVSMSALSAAWDGARELVSRLNPLSSPGAEATQATPSPVEHSQARTVPRTRPAPRPARPRAASASTPSSVEHDATPTRNTPDNSPRSASSAVSAETSGFVTTLQADNDAPSTESESVTRPLTAPPEIPARRSEIFDASDGSVTPPRPLSNPLRGMWSALAPIDAASVAVVVNEDGSVNSARAEGAPRTMAESLLLTGALSVVKGWRFRPATKDGVPVKYRLILWVGLTNPH